MSSARAQLLEQLASPTVNVLKVREICRENPGLIASAGIRLRIWSMLLLGPNEQLSEAGAESLSEPEQPCEEQQVLAADVPRTRAYVQLFQTKEAQKALTVILQTFCLKHNVQYKQGMNEILAPFIWLTPPPCGTVVPFRLFEGFLFRYLERYFCTDDHMHIHVAFKLFHLLLLFHDPQLAKQLRAGGFPPEAYAAAWLLTLYARNLELPLVHRLWDAFLAVDDPAFTLFVGLCMIQSRREEIMLSPPDELPEILTELKMTSEEEVDATVVRALKAYKATPRSFLRRLRLCSVTSPDLCPQPNANPQRSDSPVPGQPHRPAVVASAVNEDSDAVDPNSAEGILNRARRRHADATDVKLDRQQALAAFWAKDCNVQSNSDCVAITPKELLDALEGKNSELEPLKELVIIDVRSPDEVKACGGGQIARAITLDPVVFRSMYSNQLQKWLDHFDQMRGCHICLVDMPPLPMTGMRLLRRLLLGEGDGYSTADSSASPTALFKDQEELEVFMFQNGDALKLAQALQTQGFPFVSVVKGGFPALVQTLMETRGTVEPILYDHDAVQWENFMHKSGRAQLHRHYRSTSSFAASFGLDLFHNGDPQPDVTREMLTEQEQYQLALLRAEQLGHTHMAELIRAKIEKVAAVAAATAAAQQSSA